MKRSRIGTIGYGDSDVDGKVANGEMQTTYGYARVSTRDQNLDRQLRALRDFGVPQRRIFTDKASGKNFDRRGYTRLVKQLDPGDVMVISSIDRLGRDYNEILSEWHRITHEHAAHIVVLDMPLLDTRANHAGITGEFLANMVLQVLSYVAQIERENTLQRQAEGIAAAQARGVQFGRPPLKQPKCLGAVIREFEQGQLTRKEAAAKLGVGTSTFDRWRRGMRDQF